MEIQTQVKILHTYNQVWESHASAQMGGLNRSNQDLTETRRERTLALYFVVSNHPNL